MQKNAKDKLQFERQLQEEGIQYIAALDEVGQGFEKNTVFLPQLLMSADAAKEAFERIK